MSKRLPMERPFSRRPITVSSFLGDVPQLVQAGAAPWLRTTEFEVKGLFGAPTPDLRAPPAATRAAPEAPVPQAPPRAPSIAPEPEPPAEPEPPLPTREELEAELQERYRIAEAEALAAGQAKVTAILERYADTLVELEATLREAQTRDVETAVGLAMIMVRELTRRAVAVDATLLAEQLEGALRVAGAESRLRVRLGPTDRAVLEAQRPDLFTSDLEVVEDDSLGFGGCVVETPMHVIDASIQTRLGAIEEALRSSLEQALAEESAVVQSRPTMAPRVSLSPTRPSLVPPPREVA